MLPAGDKQLVQILDAALADTARRSGDWLVCKPGCTQCCVGVFAINQLDAARLQQGLEELTGSEPERAQSVRERARKSVERLTQGFPGDPVTGLLDPSEEAEARFEDFGNDEPCAALDPATGLCDLYLPARLPAASLDHRCARSRASASASSVITAPPRSRLKPAKCPSILRDAKRSCCRSSSNPRASMAAPWLPSRWPGRDGRSGPMQRWSGPVPVQSIRPAQESRTMPTKPALNSALGIAAANAGLTILSSEEGIDFNGRPTAIFRIGLSKDAPAERTLRLELSEDFDFNRPELLPEMTAHLRDEAKRLRNPRPDAYVTMAGMPIIFSDFRWPFHRSSSGADTYIVHGVVHAGRRHRFPSARQDFRQHDRDLRGDRRRHPEQPYAETFIYSAIRKTLDQGQLELLKSGNRQPVPGDHALLQPLAKEVLLYRHR